MASPSTRPYLIRAIHEWALDAGLTPQLAINADAPGVQVPAGYVRDGQIVLNVHPQAVNALILGNQVITFEARFSGKREAISIPVPAVLAVFARENGAGIQFPPEGEETPPPPDSGASGRKGGHLKIVK